MRVLTSFYRVQRNNIHDASRSSHTDANPASSTRVGGGGDESHARTHCINVISGGGVGQGNYVTRETTISSEAR